MGTTNQFPTGLREFMPGQKTMAFEVIGPTCGEPTSAVLLNGHAIKLSSKYVRLCVYISAILN